VLVYRSWESDFDIRDTHDLGGDLGGARPVELRHDIIPKIHMILVRQLVFLPAGHLILRET